VQEICRSGVEELDDTVGRPTDRTPYKNESRSGSVHYNELS